MSDYYPNIENAKMPTTGAEQIYGLVDMKGLDYDSKEWETLLNQLTISDIPSLVVLPLAERILFIALCASVPNEI